MPRIPAKQRRGDFIDAAVEVIATHGIDGATTRRIADQAQANLAMLHYCYDSKEDLFADVYEFVAGKYRAVIDSVDQDEDLSATAQRLLVALMNYYVESTSFTAASLELLAWARRQHGAEGVALFDQAMASVRSALRRSDSGHSIDDETIDEIAFVIASLADGFAVNWLTYRDGTAAEKQMKVAAGVLESWISANIEHALF